MRINGESFHSAKLIKHITITTLSEVFLHSGVAILCQRCLKYPELALVDAHAVPCLCVLGERAGVVLSMFVCVFVCRRRYLCTHVCVCVCGVVYLYVCACVCAHLSFSGCLYNIYIPRSACYKPSAEIGNNIRYRRHPLLWSRFAPCQWCTWLSRLVFCPCCCRSIPCAPAQQ